MQHWKELKMKSQMLNPRIEITLDTIRQNLETLGGWSGKKGIRITPVTKGVCGAVEVARLLAQHDIHSIGDSHIQNIRKMKEADVSGKFMLLRAPMRHEMEAVVAYSDYCLVSELETIRLLDNAAQRSGRAYQIILMVELGDRREGILPIDLDGYIRQILARENIRLAGIGANLTCLNGIKPTDEKMKHLSELADHIESAYDIELEIVSGGNSANYQWLRDTEDPGRVNHLRMGEAVLFGTDPIAQAPIEGLQTGTFVLSAEVIESRRKPSLPDGIPTYTAFGDVPKFIDEGEMNRALLAIGLQDVDPLGCVPQDPAIRIIGTTSDHMVLNSTDKLLKVGEVVKFNLTYRAMLRLMISPYVEKVFT
jgi:predicted amino acid racemase